MTTTLTPAPTQEPAPTVEDERLLKRGQIRAIIGLTKLSGSPFDRILIRSNHLYIGGRYVVAELDLQSLDISDEFVTPTFTSGTIHIDELKKWYGLEHGYLTVGDVQRFPREENPETEHHSTEQVHKYLDTSIRALNFTAGSIRGYRVAAHQLGLILRLLSSAVELDFVFMGDQNADRYRIVSGPWTIVGTCLRRKEEN